MISAPILSHNGELLVIASTERYHALLYSLLAFDLVSGGQINELWEGDDYSLTHLFFSPAAGDMRLAGLTNHSGIESLLLWNPFTGEQTDPSLGNIKGAINAFDWSPDGKLILFRTFSNTVQQLYIYRADEEVSGLGSVHLYVAKKHENGDS
jgi:WD40 repeat protein